MERQAPLANVTVRVAVLDDYPGGALTMADWSAVHAHAEVVAFAHPFTDVDATATALEAFDIVVGMRERTPFPAELIERLPNLRLLVTTGMRNRSFDLDAARRAGVNVCGTRGVGSPTSELTIGLMIALARDVVGQSTALREGGWQTRLGVGLAGKTLGIVGLGNVGSAVARVAGALGMRVIAWSQNLTEDRAESVGVVRVEKDELFATADIVSIHYALSDRSRGIVGAHEIGLLGHSSYLINTARAGLIDQDALFDALRDHRFAGAAIDVHETEPLPPDDRFRALDNVLLTPHLGYVTEENWRQMYADAVEDIVAFLDGSPIRVLS